MLAKKINETPHYYYKLNKEKALAYFNFSEVDLPEPISVAGVRLRFSTWTVPSQRRINFGIFLNTPENGASGIVDEKIQVPATKLEVSSTENFTGLILEDKYTLEALYKMNYEQIKSVAESLGITGKYKIDRLREEILKKQL